MAISNFSGDVKNEKYNRLYCSAEGSTGVREELVCLSVFNIVLSVTAFLGNTLILVAFHKERSLNPQTKLLLRTLSVTDLCVGLVTEPLIVTGWLSAVNRHWNICRYALTAVFLPIYILGPVSLMVLTAISVDRLLALLLGLRYREFVTLKRTWLTVIIIWVMSVTSASMYFWDYHEITLWCGNIGISLCLAISIFCYTKIFINLHRHQLRVHHGKRNQASQINIARYRKAVISALWLQLALVVCYLPYGIVGIVWTTSEPSPSLYMAKEFASTLVFLNSSLNPILYCWKIREVRQAVKDTLRHFGRSSTQMRIQPVPQKLRK